MATIRETLVLEDQFSSVFSAFLNLGRQLTATMAGAATGQADYNARLTEMSGAAGQAGERLNGLNRNLEDAGQGSSRAADRQKEINRELREGSSAAGDFTGKLKGLITTYVSFQGVKSALNWAGESLSLANTQRNAENQLRAVLANMGAQDITVPVTADVTVDATQAMSAFDAITNKASEIQGKGIYGDEAMIAGAAELATYFQDANAILSMMDTLSNYTMGMTGGGAVDKNAMVQYATDIGKIMTGSYTAMTKKGFEFTDAQKAIVEGTATEAQIVAELGAEYLDMSADMRAAAAINNVISESWGNLYEVMSDTPEGKIIQLKNRMGDLREMLGDAIYPAVLRLVDVINDHYPQIEKILTAFAYGCSLIIQVITWIAEAAIRATEIIEQNADIVLTVLAGIAAAAVYAGVSMAAAAVQSAVAWAVANWPLLLIAGSVALVIYMAREMGATWEDIGGVVGGVLYELYALGNNLIADAWNYLAMFAEFFANFLNHPIAATAHLVADWADWVLSIIQGLASAIDAVFGSNLADAVNGWRSGVQDWADSFGENEIKIQRMEKIQYDDAWTRGTELGRGVGKWLDDFSLSDFMNNAYQDAGADYSGLLANSGISSTLDGIGEDTKAIRSSVALSEEDIKLLVDMATREYVNNINLTAQTPIINITGQNTGDTEMDKRALADAIKDVLLEESASHTALAYT